MYLYHYYDKTTAPFLNLSDLPQEQANQVLADIRKNKPNTQTAKRTSDYMENRRYYEKILKKFSRNPVSFS